MLTFSTFTTGCSAGPRTPIPRWSIGPQTPMTQGHHNTMIVLMFTDNYRHMPTNGEIGYVTITNIIDEMAIHFSSPVLNHSIWSVVVCPVSDDKNTVVQSAAAAAA